MGSLLEPITLEKVAQMKEDENAAIARLNCAFETDGPVTAADVKMLIITSKVIKLLRVDGDDSEPNQMIRYILEREDALLWDVYQKHTEGELSYSCRVLGPYPEFSVPEDLKADWRDSFAMCPQPAM